ncbi:MAG: 16S rRNA (adenine(1518)-N(6)/adenine(1519)-N(6))-dimethyltransferase, partial [Nitrosopumilaceae archaeon]|nr:16S rRNA (adenine(1518)-N(6)/adenine(1519)-N(6))-dimethyltransferase [Nitrosopumilaceae archaeon]
EFNWPNVKIIKSDILKISNKEIVKYLGSRKYKLIANLPYQITSEVIAKFLKEDPRPSRIIIMVQREVGERMLEGAPHTNLLALMVELYSDAKKLFRVSKNSFY